MGQFLPLMLVAPKVANILQHDMIWEIQCCKFLAFVCFNIGGNKHQFTMHLLVMCLWFSLQSPVFCVFCLWPSFLLMIYFSFALETFSMGLCLYVPCWSDPVFMLVQMWVLCNFSICAVFDPLPFLWSHFKAASIEYCVSTKPRTCVSAHAPAIYKYLPSSPSMRSRVSTPWFVSPWKSAA